MADGANTAPSIFEHSGYYNLPVLSKDLRDPPNVFQSQPDLPVLTWEEFWPLRAELERHIREFAARLDPPIPEESSKLWIGDELVDRTLPVELPSYALLTPAFVKSVQESILSRHPLWRVALQGNTRDDLVLIYPRSVRVGGLPRDAPLDLALREIAGRLTTYWESREGPQRRQRAYAQALVKKDHSLGSRGFRVLCIFDNYEGDTDRLCLWLLVSGDYEKRVSVDIAGENNAVSTTSNIHVRSDGTFLDKSEFGKVPSFCASQWILPKVRMDQTLVLSNEDGSVRSTLKIDQNQILSDADLKRIMGREVNAKKSSGDKRGH